MRVIVLEVEENFKFSQTLSQANSAASHREELKRFPWSSGRRKRRIMKGYP
jgi:hypothetical protein